MLPKAEGELITLDTEIPHRAGTARVLQRRIISGRRLSREAVIAKANGDPPGCPVGVSCFDLGFVQVREIVDLPLVREDRPAFSFWKYGPLIASLS